MSKVKAGLLTSLVVAGTFGTATVAGAATHRATAVTHSSNQHAVRPRGGGAGLPGYGIVGSGQYNVAPDSWALGEATCPSGEVAVSGGPETVVNTPAVTVNSSWPSFGSRSWFVIMTNWSNYNASFSVSAICLAASSQAVIETQNETARAEGAGSAGLSCPNGLDAVGGGDAANINLFFSLNTSYGAQITSTESTWNIEMGNSTGQPLSFTGYAVCYPALVNYTIDYSGLQQVPSGSSGFVSASCPSPTVAIGGGGLTTSNYNEAGLAITSTYRVPGTVNNVWDTAFGNGSEFQRGVRASVVCAGM